MTNQSYNRSREFEIGLGDPLTQFRVVLRSPIYILPNSKPHKAISGPGWVDLWHATHATASFKAGEQSKIAIVHISIPPRIASPGSF